MKKVNNYSLLNEETLLSTANGYVGMRANFEEGYSNNYKSIVGTYINGFYDIHEICYGEMCYGFPETAQKMVNVHNAQGIWINIDGDVFSIFEGRLKDMHRELDIERGYALRKVRWQSPKGHNLELTFRRMASFACLELITIDIEIKSVDYEGDIEIVSRLEGTAKNQKASDDPRSGSETVPMLNAADNKIVENAHIIYSRTSRSKLSVATACTYNQDMNFGMGDGHSEAKTRCAISKGESIRFVKYIAFADSIRHADLQETALNTAREAAAKGVDSYYADQKKYLDKFWEHAHINLSSDKEVEYALNYSVYQLLSSAGKDEYCNIGAKGLSGGGYDGHYFWDTEIYMIPFFTLAMPDIAKNLLKFRYTGLEEARKRAFEMGHKRGAKMPWRTINGAECSSYFPAGSAQYHINGDIAYAYIQYYLFTDDFDVIKDFGYEVIYETARIWLEAGNYNAKGEFCINTVTGPDEYTALVDNNYYTNSLAKYHLDWTVRFGEMLKDDDAEIFGALAAKLGITDDEILQMKKAAENMALPFDEDLNIYMQDESFLSKKEWDFENTPKDKYPLLLHYHPLHIYRHKVLKQADTILSYILLDDVKEDIMQDSYEYYRQRTTHDSSLSSCVHSIMASRIDRVDEAYDYFMSAIKLDLDDLNKNTRDGLHIANAGGAYMALVYGFGGLRIKENGLHLRPVKPSQWREYSFRINYRGAMVNVQVSDEIQISCDKPTAIYVYDKKYLVESQLEIGIR